MSINKLAEGRVRPLKIEWCFFREGGHCLKPLILCLFKGKHQEAPLNLPFWRWMESTSWSRNEIMMGKGSKMKATQNYGKTGEIWSCFVWGSGFRGRWGVCNQQVREEHIQGVPRNSETPRGWGRGFSPKLWVPEHPANVFRTEPNLFKITPNNCQVLTPLPALPECDKITPGLWNYHMADK